MNIFVKKSLSIITTLGVLASVASFSVSALDSGMESNTLYISSESVPQAATDYARDMFSHFTTDELAGVDFSFNEAVNLKLGTGFRLYEVEENPLVEINYFPVYSGTNIVDILLVHYYENKYGFQMGDKELASKINALSTAAETPAKIAASDVGFYSVINNNVTLIDEIGFGSDAENDAQIAEDMNILANMPAPLSENGENVITLSAETTFSDSVKVNTTKADIGIILPVARCNNVPGPGYKDGAICWASCGGALIDYYQNGSYSSQANAERIRDQLTGGVIAPAGTSTTQERMQELIPGLSMTIIPGILFFSDLQNEIRIKNAPFYTRWHNLNTGGTTGFPRMSHAMVIKGYTYDSVYPNNLAYCKVYMMDPNNNAIAASAGFSQVIHIFGTAAYNWEETMIRG